MSKNVNNDVSRDSPIVHNVPNKTNFNFLEVFKVAILVALYKWVFWGPLDISLVAEWSTLAELSLPYPAILSITNLREFLFSRVGEMNNFLIILINFS